jgi:hypothetical protein
MNDTTTASLTQFRDYWKNQSPLKEIADEQIATIDDLLADPPSISDRQWEEFFARLEGPEGCDFKDGENGITWMCGGGNDKTKADAILVRMGIGDSLRPRLLKLVDVLGGHCDCEILLNAGARILGEEGAS